MNERMKAPSKNSCIEFELFEPDNVAVAAVPLVLAEYYACGSHSGRVPSLFCSHRPLLWAKTSGTLGHSKILPKSGLDVP